MRVYCYLVAAGLVLPTLLLLGPWAGQVAGQQASMPLPPQDFAPRPDSGAATAVAESGAQQETLAEAWLIALGGDQRVEASRWNLSAAQSTWAAAKAERLPSLKMGADYLALSEQPSVSVNIPSLPTMSMPMFQQDSAGFHGLVSQPLYTSGRISNGISAAESAMRANQSDVRRTKLDIKMNVAEIYVAVLRATRIVDVAQSKVVSLSGHNHDVAGLFEKGLVSKNDLLAAQVALADARQQAFDAQNGMDLGTSAYNRALGRRLTEPVRLAELRDEGDACDVEELTQMALRERPELEGLSAQVRALREQAASLRAKNGPQVNVQGGYVFQENKFIDPNGFAVVLVGVEWNAFDSGRVRNQAESLCDKAEATLRLRRDAESMIALEVRQKWLDLQTARQRVQVARQATAQADENLRVARDRYQQQVGTNTEVLDAETLRIQAYTNFYNSSYQAVLAGLRLRRAVGNL